MTRTMQEIDWEIRQLAQAIDYYELAARDLPWEAKSYKKTVKKLEKEIAKLEAEKDGRYTI